MCKLFLTKTHIQNGTLQICWMGTQGNIQRMQAVSQLHGRAWSGMTPGSLYNDGVVKELQPHDLLGKTRFLLQGRSPVTSNVLYELLKENTILKDLEAGRQLCLLIMKNHFGSNTFLFDNAIRMFASCGNLSEALIAFENVPKPSIYTWNAIISAHVNLGCSVGALNLYYEMKTRDIRPDTVTMLCILRACCDIGIAGNSMQIHDQIIRAGYDSSLAIGNALLDMYCKYGKLDEAEKVFSALQKRDIVSWGAMIAGYVQHGHSTHALESFRKMYQEDIQPNFHVFSSALKACSNTGDLKQGKVLHDWIIRSGIYSDVILFNCLIDMYAKCGSIDEARNVFNGLANPDVVSWGSMIAGYATHGPIQLVFELFKGMQKAGLRPCKATFLSILKACVTGSTIKYGIIVHNKIIINALESDITIGNALVDMYSKCGSLREAQRIFDSLKGPNVVSWGALISGYSAHGCYNIAVEKFEEMQCKGITPSDSIICCILRVCGHIKHLTLGRQIHFQIVDHGFQSQLIGTVVTEMYSRCECFDDAEETFRHYSANVHAWAALMVGYCLYHCFADTLKLYEMMRQHDIEPNNVIFSCVLKACTMTGNIENGMRMHEDVVRSGLDLDLIVGNTLIGMYSKFGWTGEATKVFSMLQSPDLVSWGAMITGFVEHGEEVVALDCLDKLQGQGMKPSKAIILCSLKACGNIGAFVRGSVLNDHVIRNSLEKDVVVSSSIVDMYLKCGKLEEARKMFDSLSHQDVVAWGALVAGYALNGSGKLAKQVFMDMRVRGLEVDEVIFTNIIAACSQAGLVNDGFFYFRSLIQDFGMTPTIEQYGSMIDLLGRAGHLIEAEQMLWTIPLLPDLIARLSLLTSCRTYGSIQQG